MVSGPRCLRKQVCVVGCSDFLRIHQIHALNVAMFQGVPIADASQVWGEVDGTRVVVEAAGEEDRASCEQAADMGRHCAQAARGVQRQAQVAAQQLRQGCAPTTL